MLEGKKERRNPFEILFSLFFSSEKDEFTHGNVSFITDKDILLAYRIGQPILFTHIIVRCCFWLVLIWTGSATPSKQRFKSKCKERSRSLAAAG